MYQTPTQKLNTPVDFDNLRTGIELIKQMVDAIAEEKEPFMVDAIVKTSYLSTLVVTVGGATYQVSKRHAYFNDAHMSIGDTIRVDSRRLF